MRLAVPLVVLFTVSGCRTKPSARDMEVASAPATVLRHHNHASRDGVYAEPAFTRAAAVGIRRDRSFDGAIEGNVYAQPLYLDGAPGGKALLLTVTESNNVYALDAATGRVVWQKNVGAPVPLGRLPCGNIDPLGITGTPVIDLASRTMFFDAMTTPDGGTTKKHLIFAIGADSGDIASGWPVDVSATAAFNGLKFDSPVQNQRGALAIVGDTLYVPFGGHYGDCGLYNGWVVGVSLSNPAKVRAWATRVRAGGAWAVSGIASDGVNLFVATGNTIGGPIWGDGEAIIRLQAGPEYTQMPTDYFTPSDWKALDDGDVDIGGTGPVLVDVPGANPSKLVVALGKNGWAYLANRDNLGGVGGALAMKQVASREIINAAVAYTTSKGTYVVFKGIGVGCPGGAGDLTAIRIGATSPPAITVAWCAMQNGEASPMVTTSDGVGNFIVWSYGAEGDQRLRAFDGDTGAVIYGGGGDDELMAGTRRYNTPIAAGGRIFIAADNRVYAFKP